MFLFPQKWNAALAQVASDYADNCLFAHNANRHTEYGSSVGENLYFYSRDLSRSKNLSRVVDAWDAEKQYYDYATQSCSKAPCGHYTQVIMVAKAIYS